MENKENIINICYIFREKEKMEHSIENVFNVIAKEVGNKSNINVFKWVKPKSLFKTIVELYKLRRRKYDIYHITGDVNYLWLFLPNNKTVMTIHDIGFYKNRDYKSFKIKIFTWISFILGCRYVAKTTVVSSLVLADLNNILNIKVDNIMMIPNPIVLPVSFVPKVFDSNKPRILQIGTGEHKNLLGLIESVKDIPCIIDIVGQPDEKLILLMEEYHIEYDCSHHLSQSELLEKYHNCDILYFASFSEGFGLPIIEAQGIGRIVLTSDLEPTRSVLGEGGFIVNPYDYSAINKALKEIIYNSSLREEKIAKGLQNIHKYNPKNIAQKYIDCYDLVNL